MSGEVPSQQSSATGRSSSSPSSSGNRRRFWRIEDYDESIITSLEDEDGEGPPDKTQEEEEEEETEEEDVECYFDEPTSMEDLTVGQERNVAEWWRRRLLAAGRCRVLAEAAAPHVASDFINALEWSFRMALTTILVTFFARSEPFHSFFGCT